MQERQIANIHHAGGDGDRGEGVAMPEGIVANGGDTVGDGDRGELSTAIERLAANSCHLQGLVIKGHLLGDDEVARVFPFFGTDSFITERNRQLGTIIYKVVKDSIAISIPCLNIVGTRCQRQQGG